MAVTLTEASFFTQAWADAARAAWNAGPSEETRAAKVAKFWEWIDRAKQGQNCTLGLVCADLDRSVTLRIEAGDVVEAVAGEAGPAIESATYVLSGSVAGWRDLLEGYDVGRTVMYRKLILTKGEVLDFFKAAYYWTESLACLQQIPTRFG